MGTALWVDMYVCMELFCTCSSFAIVIGLELLCTSGWPHMPPSFLISVRLPRNGVAVHSPAPYAISAAVEPLDVQTGHHGRPFLSGRCSLRDSERGGKTV